MILSILISLLLCSSITVPMPTQPDGQIKYEAPDKQGLLKLASQYATLHSNFIKSAEFILQRKYENEKYTLKVRRTLGDSKKKLSNLKRIISKIKSTKVTRENFPRIIGDVQNQGIRDSYQEIIDNWICWYDPDCDNVPGTTPGGLPVPDPSEWDPMVECNALGSSWESQCSSMEDALEECGHGTDAISQQVVSQCNINAAMAEQLCELSQATGVPFDETITDYTGIIASICIVFSPNPPQTESTENKN